MVPTENRGLGPFENTTVIDMNDVPDELKLSAKLIEVMTPWMAEIDLSTLANCAVLAWNASVNGVENYTNLDFLRDGSIEDSTENKALIEKLKKRKSKLYPNDMRTIVRMQIQKGVHGDPRIVVAHELKPENMIKTLRRLTSFRAGENDGE
ncbi:MAG TPA: hypothetical protein PKE04_04345 [Clostridia bacterium]|nr:hypothetical protein [Clostridia bacterium]